MISKDRLILQSQVYNFLRTITIKFSPLADYVNATLLRKGYAVDSLNPYSWKYYLNMQGIYHISDTKMYVISLDTQETILFDKDVLKSHPRTRSVYLPGNIYYDRLCKLYPEQVDLIKSILFPVTDIEKVMLADDLTLLQYGTGFLEEYEEKPIVDEIKKFLAILNERWYFDFLADEPYFHITFWASVPVYLAMVIMSAREDFINTSYVHSYHIWNKLKSVGLDDYSDILDREKSIMLYQNIDYFQKNAGKQSTLELLGNRLLDSFGVSIYSRRVVQESETNAASYQLIPQLQAVKVPTNNETVTAEITTETVQAIQEKIYSKGLTKDNTAEEFDARERRLGDTTLNNFSTKLLEIRPITKNKVYADILNVFILETLITSVIRGYYNKPVSVTDISTNTYLYLYPNELLAIYHYATLKSLGITAENIPNKFELYKSFLTTIGTPDKTFINNENELIYVSQYVDASSYLSGLDYKTNLDDPNDFTAMVSRLWLRYMDHLLEDQSTKIKQKHDILAYLSQFCHTRRIETATLIPNYTSYDDWFGINGIDIQSSVVAQYNLKENSEATWGNLADAIITALLPIDDTLNFFGNFTLSDFGYERLRQLFVQMCSYRVLFLESDREIPEFGIGSKWSTRCGPDESDTYVEHRDTNYVNFTTTVEDNDIIRHHDGFIMHEKSIDENVVKHKLTTVTILNDLACEIPENKTNIGKIFLEEIQTDGMLDLSYTSWYPDGLLDDSKSSFLLDSDNSFIMDSDNSFIEDPNID